MDLKSRRRIYQLACHLESGLQLQSGVPSIVRSECSGGPTFIRRDCTLLFARQGIESRGPFGRPEEFKQTTDVMQVSLVTSEVEKQPKTSATAGKPEEEEEPYYGKAVKSHENETPLFAKPTACKPDEKTGSQEKTVPVKQSSESSDFEWSPRMDVMESDTEYIVTLELPGVNADGIRVEIDSGRLVVTGFRSREWWANPEMLTQSAKDNNSKVYHRSDLSYGPYRSVWVVPKNASASAATAEFIDGFLRVMFPKL